MQNEKPIDEQIPHPRETGPAVGAQPAFVVGLAGGSGSGKSTLARALADALGQLAPPLTVEMISTDRYFLPLDKMPRFFSAALGEEMPDYNQPESIDSAALVRDLAARRAAPDHPDVLIVEGLLVLYLEDVRAMLDLRLFVDLESDVRALRRLVRNLEAQYAPTPWLGTPRGMAAYFIESSRPGYDRYTAPSRQHADLLLRGDADFSRSAPMLATLIAGMMK